MRVLVTGANGFVGKRVARALTAAGFDVIRTDLRAQAADDFVACDILSADGRKTLAEQRVEVCVHCAWYAEPGKYLSSPINVDLMVASVALAKELAGAGCAHFVGLGTCFEYDTSVGLLSESTPLQPRHVYSRAKAATCFGVSAVGAATGMRVAWARLFYMYGPDEHPMRLVPSVIKSLLGGRAAEVTLGEQVRDFTHVEDVGSAIAHIVKLRLEGPINVASGRPITVAEIVRRIGAAVGRPELVRLGARPYAPDDPMFVCAETTRLRATGFKPQWDIERGLDATVDWWRSRVEPCS